MDPINKVSIIIIIIIRRSSGSIPRVPSHVHSYNACVSKVDEDDDDQERLSLLYGVCSSAGDHHNKSLRHDKSVHCSGLGLVWNCGRGAECGDSRL